MKLNNLVVASLVVASASAFAPPHAQPRAFVRQPTVALRMADEELTPTPPTEPIPAEAALVPIKEETIEFTAGIIGGIVGLAVGGPVIGAIGACIANYASKTDGDVAEAIATVSKSSIEVYNYLLKLDVKYSVLEKAKASLDDALVKAKGSQADTETVEKVENALRTTTSKISEINDEYDLVGAGVTALGITGDLVEKAVSKASELNAEYKLTDKATETLKTAVEQAKNKVA